MQVQSLEIKLLERVIAWIETFFWRRCGPQFFHTVHLHSYVSLSPLPRLASQVGPFQDAAFKMEVRLSFSLVALVYAATWSTLPFSSVFRKLLSLRSLYTLVSLSFFTPSLLIISLEMKISDPGKGKIVFTDPPIKTQFGYHIIMVEGRKWTERTDKGRAVLDDKIQRFELVYSHMHYIYMYMRMRLRVRAWVCE